MLHKYVDFLQMKELLGIEQFIPMSMSVADMGRSLMSKGFVKAPDCS